MVGDGNGPPLHTLDYIHLLTKGTPIIIIIIPLQGYFLVEAVTIKDNWDIMVLYIYLGLRLVSENAISGCDYCL